MSACLLAVFCIESTGSFPPAGSQLCFDHSLADCSNMEVPQETSLLRRDLENVRGEAQRLRDLLDATRRWLASSRARGIAAEDIVCGVEDLLLEDVLGLSRSPSASPIRWQLVPTPAPCLACAEHGKGACIVSCPSRIRSRPTTSHELSSSTPSARSRSRGRECGHTHLEDNSVAPSSVRTPSGSSPATSDPCQTLQDSDVTCGIASISPSPTCASSAKSVCAECAHTQLDPLSQFDFPSW